MASEALLQACRAVLPDDEVLDAVPLYQGSRRRGAADGMGRAFTGLGGLTPLIAARERWRRWFTLVDTPTALVVLANRPGRVNQPVAEAARISGGVGIGMLDLRHGPIVRLAGRDYRVPDTLVDPVTSILQRHDVG